ncbi:F-box and associated interaction domains-containing protein [Prunus dulcis]|uniref:F-box and associated interaction domains-containing protein n=1 Tax=Prunus dulcis TaxID=3755 RepID=A0A4Y1QNQ1_PRUDU|nr:F-box and associated interaction domains-containing protein [Prunus dulcis]
MKKTKLLHSHPPNEHEEDEEEERRRKDMKPYILQLPNHLTVEIFCKIPIKALIQCRCVCKSWRCSLSDPEFTKYLFSEAPTCLLLQNSSSRNPNSTGLFLIDLDNASSRNDVVIKLHKDPNVPTLVYKSWVPAMASYAYTTGSTMADFMSPTPFWLVLVSSPSEGCNQGEIMVLTVGSGGWRNVGNFVYPFPFGYQSCGIFHNGFLHWISQCSDNSVLICAFDLEGERFQELPLPPWSLEKPLISLGVLKGWLSILSPPKDYGVQESWTKELVLKQVIGYSASSSATQVLKFTKKGKVLFFQKYKLRVYTPGKRGSIRQRYVDEMNVRKVMD